MTRDQDRLRRSTEAYRTLGRAAVDIGERLEDARAAAAPQAPRRPGTLVSGGSDGPADPVHAQVAQLEQHLRARGGPLHRVRIVLVNLNELAASLEADHRLEPGFADRVAQPRVDVRTGLIGARIHVVGRLAGEITLQLTLLNEAIHDAWRDMWRRGADPKLYAVPAGVAYSAQPDELGLLDQALMTYGSAASYAASIARSLTPYQIIVDDRPRCGDCGFRLVKYRRLGLCGACYSRSRRQAAP